MLQPSQANVIKYCTVSLLRIKLEAYFQQPRRHSSFQNLPFFMKIVYEQSLFEVYLPSNIFFYIIVDPDQQILDLVRIQKEKTNIPEFQLVVF